MAAADSIAVPQLTRQHIGRRGCESWSEYLLPPTTSNLHPLPHTSILTPNLPTVPNCCQGRG